jgi:hypothetical protein
LPQQEKPVKYFSTHSAKFTEYDLNVAEAMSVASIKTCGKPVLYEKPPFSNPVTKIYICRCYEDI